MARRSFRRWTIVAAVATLSVALVACGGSSSTAPGASDENLVADPNGAIRVGFVIPPAPLNPHKVASDIGAYAYLAPVYDRLTQMVSGENGAELAPMVATEWEFAPDGLSATFTLRDDVTFSDGAKLDAAAVKANIDHALQTPDSTAKTYLSVISGADVVDPTHVVIRTTRPASDLPYVLSGASGSLISPAALDNPDLDVNPVGSGPYTATSVKIGDSVAYERRDGYWDPTAQQAKSLTITGIVDDNARLNALRSGQIDIAYSPVTSYNQSSKLGSGFGFFSYPEANVYSLQLNTGRQNVDNVKFRQALNYAVDREGISASLTADQCVPNGQPLAPERVGHLDTPPVDYSYDPQKARDLLAEAGIQNPSLSVVIPTGLSLQEGLASALQAQFREVGVDMQIQQGDPATSSAEYAQGAYDGYVQSRTPLPASNQSLARFYLNARGFPGPVSPGVQDAVLASYDPNIDEAARDADIERAATVATEDALDVFICAVPTQFAYSENVIAIDSMGVSNFQGIFDLRYVGIAAK